MSRTDQSVLSEIQRLLIEPIDGGRTWSVGLWTVAEAVALLNEQLTYIAKVLGVVLTETTISTPANQHRHTLPADALHVVGVTWQGADGVWKVLQEGDSWELDYGKSDWEYETAASPDLWSVIEMPQRSVQIAPAAWDAGVLHIWYIPRPTQASATGNPVTLNLPDEIVEIVKWAVFALLLGKIGRSADPHRAEMAGWLARVLLTGATTFIDHWE